MDSMGRNLFLAVALLLGLVIAWAAQAKDHKVTICHKGNEISVSENAADAHLRNHEGDKLGPCEPDVVCPCWTAEQVAAAMANAVANGNDVICAPGAVERFPDDDEFDLFAYFETDDGPNETFGDVDYSSSLDGELYFSECEVFVDGDGAGAGIDPIEVDDISLEEAVACQQAIADACPVLLP